MDLTVPKHGGCSGRLWTACGALRGSVTGSKVLQHVDWASKRQPCKYNVTCCTLWGTAATAVGPCAEIKRQTHDRRGPRERQRSRLPPLRSLRDQSRPILCLCIFGPGLSCNGEKTRRANIRPESCWEPKPAGHSSWTVGHLLTWGEKGLFISIISMAENPWQLLSYSKWFQKRQLWPSQKSFSFVLVITQITQDEFWIEKSARMEFRWVFFHVCTQHSKQQL